MVMNYYRHMDRSRLQFDFLVHRETPGIYEEEIRRLGGRGRRFRRQAEPEQSGLCGDEDAIVARALELSDQLLETL